MGLKSLIFGKGNYVNEEELIENRAPIRNLPDNFPKGVSPKIKGDHVFLEFGTGKPIIFCHGLFGGIFNISKVAESIAERYRFIMPYLPMYDMPLIHCTIPKLGDYLGSFIKALELTEAVIIGSSMGGGTALYYALQQKNIAKGLVLCGSSGLSSIPLAKGFFKRKDFNFVKEATRDIFSNRTVPPDEMVQDVFNAIQSYEVVLRSIRFTKAATGSLMHEELPLIHTPVLLVWGRQDPITPVAIAPVFQALLPNSSLEVFDDCGHVPTQEQPELFLRSFFEFLSKLKY